MFVKSAPVIAPILGLNKPVPIITKLKPKKKYICCELGIIITKCPNAISKAPIIIDRYWPIYLSAIIPPTIGVPYTIDAYAP
ncbi:hypothetical protein fh0823_22830 [Francisella halioticida]|nr:hypothetical protein fh0823_22830 [Francisella halioticida]